MGLTHRRIGMDMGMGTDMGMGMGMGIRRKKIDLLKYICFASYRASFPSNLRSFPNPVALLLMVKIAPL